MLIFDYFCQTSVKYFKEASKVNPYNAGTYLWLAILCCDYAVITKIKNKDPKPFFEECIVYCNKTLSIQQKEEIYPALALSLFELGKIDEAGEVFEKINPEKTRKYEKHVKYVKYLEEKFNEEE